MKMLMALAVAVAFMLAIPALGFGGDLHEAAKKKDVEAVKVLLKAGADVNARDKDGGTPLYAAVFWGHVELVKLLLEAGANVNAKGIGGDTPLHLAAIQGNVGAVKVLREAGAK